MMMLTWWNQVRSTEQMAKQLRALGESFVAEFILRHATEGKFEAAQPQLCHLPVHHLVMLVRVDVVVSIFYFSELLCAFKSF